MMEELLEVVNFHLLRCKNTVKMCKTSLAQINPFATKFVAKYLFIKVKGLRSMTYQYLMLDMVSVAKENGGFIEKTFKTASKFGFDSLIATNTSMQRHAIPSFFKTLLLNKHILHM